MEAMQSDAVLQAMYDVYANDACDESIYMQTMQAMKAKYAMQEMQAMQTVQALQVRQGMQALQAMQAVGRVLGQVSIGIKRETKKLTHAECRLGSAHN